MAHARGDDLPPGQRDALGLSSEDYAELHREQKGFAAGWIVGRRPWAIREEAGDEATGLTLFHAGSNTYWYVVAWVAPETDWVLLAATNAAGEAGTKATDAAVGVVLEQMAR